MKTGDAIVAKQLMKKDPKLGEIIIREGAAEIIREPKILDIVGTIEAPRKFIEKRYELHNTEDVHVLFSRDKMEIILNVDEKDYFGGKITGKLFHNPEFSEFGINSQKTFTIKGLQEFLKMRKYFFSDKDENMKIVSNLGKFKASVQTQLEQSGDTRGNKSASIDVKVDSNIDLNFTLNMPIFKGQPNNKFVVEICFDVRDAAVSVWLESSEVKETELQIRDSIIEKELKAFDKYVVIEV